MDDLKIDEPIAKRILSLGNDDVLVTIGKPRLFKDGNDYRKTGSGLDGSSTWRKDSG